MKIKSIITKLTVAVVALVSILSMASCSDSENFYTKTDVDGFIAELEAEIAEKSAAADAEIAALKADYDAKIAALTAKDDESAAKIEELTATYNEKVAALEKADSDNAAALATLKSEYEAKVAELAAADSENKTAIEKLTADYNAKVAALEKADSDNAAALATLKSEYEAKVAELATADSENKTAIEKLTADYNAKVAALEKADSDNAAALATLKSEYEAKVAELASADSENKAAIEKLTADYNAKVVALEKADSDNATALATLKSEYEAKVAELNNAIAANSTKIAELETALNTKITEVKADYAAKFTAVEALITALQQTDTDNVKRIAQLEAQMNALLSQHEHTFGEWVLYNSDDYCENRLSYRVCKECNVMEWKHGAYSDHKFSMQSIAPTCTTGGYDISTCTVCNKIEKYYYNNKLGHSFGDVYLNNIEAHWLKCENCNATTAEEKHVVDDSMHCKICDIPIWNYDNTSITPRLVKLGNNCETVANYNEDGERIFVTYSFDEGSVGEWALFFDVDDLGTLNESNKFVFQTDMKIDSIVPTEKYANGNWLMNIGITDQDGMHDNDTLAVLFKYWNLDGSHFIAPSKYNENMLPYNQWFTLTVVTYNSGEKAEGTEYDIVNVDIYVDETLVGSLEVNNNAKIDDAVMAFRFKFKNTSNFTDFSISFDNISFTEEDIADIDVADTITSNS